MNSNKVFFRFNFVLIITFKDGNISSLSKTQTGLKKKDYFNPPTEEF